MSNTQRGEFRARVEKALGKAGLDVKSRAVYTDTTYSGRRIKYVNLVLTPKQLAKVHKAVRKEFKNYGTRSWNHPAANSFAAGGLCVKVFDFQPKQRKAN